MNNLKQIFIEVEDETINLYINSVRKIIWINQKEIAKLYGKSKSTISRNIKLFKTISVVAKNETTEHKIETTGIDGKKYFINFFNNFLLDFLDAKFNSKKGKILYEKCFIIESNDEQIKEIEKFEIVRYNQGKFNIDVRVSPSDETVWMTQEEIALLFETTQQNISLHINNIINDNELDVSVHKDYLYTAPDNKNYYVQIYNLDMVLAIGYRVRSKRAIEFRKWASKILKNYLLKGYAIDDERINKVELAQLLLETRIQNIENKVEDMDNKHILFYKNRSIDAYAFLTGIINGARKSIIFIDPYADSFTLSVLSSKDKSVRVIVVGSSKSKIDNEQIEIFNRENGNLTLIKNNDNHDRYLIIDNEVCFEIGSSINSFGYHDSHVSKNFDSNFIEELVDKYVGEEIKAR